MYKRLLLRKKNYMLKRVHLIKEQNEGDIDILGTPISVGDCLLYYDIRRKCYCIAYVIECLKAYRIARLFAHQGGFTFKDTGQYCVSRDPMVKIELEQVNTKTLREIERYKKSIQPGTSVVHPLRRKRLQRIFEEEQRENNDIGA